MEVYFNFSYPFIAQILKLITIVFCSLFCFRDGILTKCEILGEVQVNSHLSGLPELTLSFANASILNDVRFHPCVRFRPWEIHQVLSFVPPDGQFTLMSYRSL